MATSWQCHTTTDRYIMAMSYHNTWLHHGNVIPQHTATSWQCHTKTGPHTPGHTGLYIPDPRGRHAISEGIVGSCLRVGYCNACNDTIFAACVCVHGHEA